MAEHDCPVCGTKMIEAPKPRRRWDDWVTAILIVVMGFGTVTSAIEGRYDRASWFAIIAVFLVVTDSSGAHRG